MSLFWGCCFFGRNLDECETQSAPAFFKIIFINGVQFAHRMNREMVFAFHLEAA